MFSVFTIFYCYIPVLVLVHSYILAEGTAKGVEKGRKGAERGGRERGMMLYCTNVDCSVNLEVNILT